MNSLPFRKITSFILVLSTAGVCAHAQTIIKTQSFDTEISAQSDGWWEYGSRENGQDFGFSHSGFASGQPGEAGGMFRRNSVRSGYFDTWTGRLTLEDRLEARGLIVMTDLPTGNAGTVIGYSDTTRVGSETEANVLGFNTVVGPQLFVHLVLANGVRLETVIVNPIHVFQTYEWEFVYDPDGGDGHGRLIATIHDTFTGESHEGAISLTAAQRAVGASFNSFGMTSRALSTQDVVSWTYMDDVEYTALTGGAALELGPLTSNGDPAIEGRVGLQGPSFHVWIPPSLVMDEDITLVIESEDTSIAVAEGADASGILTRILGAGQWGSHSFSLETRSAGNTKFHFRSEPERNWAQTTLDVTVLQPSRETIVKNESFDTVETARNNGWVELGTRELGQDYGFSPTSHAGGQAGEAGGLFKRDITRSAYMDVWGGRLTLDDRLEARGRFVMTDLPTGNSGTVIGFSDSTRVGSNSEANVLGFNTVVGPQIFAHIVFANGSRSESVLLDPVEVGQTYDWEFIYDPLGGAGHGELRVTVTHPVTGETHEGIRTLTEAQRAIGATFDGFGMTARALSSQDVYSWTYMDDVEYTALPGEPCIQFQPSHLLAVVGQSNKTVSVTIPSSANAVHDFELLVGTDRPDVARPLGADSNNVLRLNFPAGANVVQTFSLEAIAPGTSQIQFVNAEGICMDGEVLVEVPVPTESLSRSQEFMSAASAEADGWLEVNSRTGGQDFGFYPGDVMGDGTGAAGGAFRRVSERSHYADTFGGRLTLNDPIEASGRLLLVVPPEGNSINIGHFDSAVTGIGGRNVLGFTVAGPASLPQVGAFIGLDSGAVTEVIAPSRIDVAAGALDWNYLYDPTGGPTGNGRFEIRLVPMGGLPIEQSVNLTAQQRAVGASFDSFGILYRGLGNPNPEWVTELYIDSLTYDTVEAPMGALEVLEVRRVGTTLEIRVISPRANGVHKLVATEQLSDEMQFDDVDAEVSVDSGIITFRVPISPGIRYFRAHME